jgi:hypothetical protein
MPSSTRLSSAERARAYRQRIRTPGTEDVLFGLPSEIVTLLKERQNLCSRSQVLLQLIDQGRRPARK